MLYPIVVFWRPSRGGSKTAEYSRRGALGPGGVGVPQRLFLPITYTTTPLFYKKIIQKDFIETVGRNPGLKCTRPWLSFKILAFFVVGWKVVRYIKDNLYNIFGGDAQALGKT